MTSVPPTILVIDDSEAVLSRITDTLERAGFPVITSTQPVGTARHLVAASIVIIDFHMPGLDGVEVLTSLRAAADLLGRPVSFYLYTSDEDVARRARSLGFDGAIRNKGNLDALLLQVNSLARLLALKGMLR